MIRNVTVYGENNVIHNGYIKVVDEKISEIGSVDDLSSDHCSSLITLNSDYSLIPGMIDVHIHGAAGADTMDASQEALETMACALPSEGTTSFLATTMTQEAHLVERALSNAGRYIDKQQSAGKAEIIGIHLEGPFISQKRAGAQPSNYILPPSISLFEKWQKIANGHIKVVTLAPEEKNGIELIRHLKEKGIVASIGHSDASYQEVERAVVAGASQVTHLFNGMRGMHHREPGVVGAALLHDELKVELIADGIHVRPEMIKLTYHQKKKSGMILITDSIRAKCLKNGRYDLGGQEVHVSEGKAELQDGTLAGSVLKMNHAVKNVLSYTGCSLEEVVEMTAANPAKQLNIWNQKGSLRPGKDADFVIMDKSHNVMMTFCRGRLAYKRGE